MVRSMLRTTAVTMALAVPWAAAAQQAPAEPVGITAGERLRVTVPSAGLLASHAVLEAVPGDSVRLRFPGDRVATLPIATITRLSVARGHRSRLAAAPRRGLGGAVLGAGVGLVLRAARGDGWGLDHETVATAAAVGLGAGLVTALVAPGPAWHPVQGSAVALGLGLTTTPPPPRIRPGDSARVLVAGSPLAAHEGRIAAVEENALFVQGPHGAVTRLPREDVQFVLLHRGERDRQSAARGGADAGSLAGSLLGILGGGLAYALAEAAGHDQPHQPALVTYFGTAFLGGAVGAILSAADPGPLWQSVALDPRS